MELECREHGVKVSRYESFTASCSTTSLFAREKDLGGEVRKIETERVSECVCVT